MVHHLALEYVNKGHQVSILAPVPSSSSPRPYHVHPMEELSDPATSRESKWEKGRRWLSRNLVLERNRFDFDVLHAHFAYPYGYVAGVWGRENHVATVLTCHGIDIMHLPQWHFGVRPKQIDNFTKTFHAVDRVVTVSRNLEKEVLELGCPAEKLSTIPNGVVPEEYDPISTAVENPAIILAMGRMEEVKGFDLLLEIFTAVSSKRGNTLLHLVGQGPEFYRLLEISLRLGLREKVVFKKATIGEEKIRLLEDCTLFICPSRWEGMPLVILEAMAAGKAVVAFDVGGIGEIIRHGQNGVLVPPFDTGVMTEEVIELLDNPSKRKRLGTKARQTALKNTWNNIADRYLELYREMLHCIPDKLRG